MVKKIAIALLWVICFSCNSEETKTNFSTVDSNTTEPVDTTPAILYLDNPNDSSFSIAIDSTVQQEKR